MNVLREIEAFLRRNPSEVITIFIEDYVEAPMGLTRVFNASGLTPYLFPVRRMPKNGGDWPLLSDMVRDHHRLLDFTSRSAKEAAEDTTESAAKQTGESSSEGANGLPVG